MRPARGRVTGVESSHPSCFGEFCLLCQSGITRPHFASGPIIVVCFIFGFFFTPNEWGDRLINSLNKNRLGG